MIKGKIKLCCWYTCCWKLVWFCCQKRQTLANPLGPHCYSLFLCDWTECWPSLVANWPCGRVLFLLSPCRHTSICDGFTWAWREAWPVSVLACLSVILCAFKGMVHAKLTLMSFHICKTFFCETQGYLKAHYAHSPYNDQGIQKNRHAEYIGTIVLVRLYYRFFYLDVSLYWIFICSC